MSCRGAAAPRSKQRHPSWYRASRPTCFRSPSSSCRAQTRTSLRRAEARAGWGPRRWPPAMATTRMPRRQPRRRRRRGRCRACRAAMSVDTGSARTRMMIAPQHPSSRKMFVPYSRATPSWSPPTPAPSRWRVERFKRVRSSPCEAPSLRNASAGGGLLEELLRVSHSPTAAKRRSPAFAAGPYGAATTRERVIWVGRDRAPGSSLAAARRPSRHRPASPRGETTRRG